MGSYYSVYSNQEPKKIEVQCNNKSEDCIIVANYSENNDKCLFIVAQQTSTSHLLHEGYNNINVLGFYCNEDEANIISQKISNDIPEYNVFIYCFEFGLFTNLDFTKLMDSPIYSKYRNGYKINEETDMDYSYECNYILSEPLHDVLTYYSTNTCV